MNTRFPMRFLILTIGLGSLLLIGLMRSVYVSYQSVQTAREAELKLHDLWGNILTLDQQLSMTVQLATATRNPIFETQYRSIKSKLDALIQEAITLAPESKRALSAVDAAHIKSVEIENFVFSLIASRNPEEAETLLSSPEYTEQKKLYAMGLEKFIFSLKKTVETNIIEIRQKLLNYTWIVFFLNTLLVVFFIFILLRWKKATIETNQTLQKQEATLIETNQRLEREASERKQLQEQLLEQAIHDPLTGLYNRRYFNQRCAEEMTRAKRSGRSFAILLCDLDRFKVVNDAFGHPVGDEILKSIAKNLKEALREVDLVFRWGGDEFIIILPDTPSGGFLGVAERIRKKVRSVNDSAEVTIDLSIGAAFYPDHGTSLEDLVQVADRALYFAKKTQSHVHIGDEEYKLNEAAITMVFQPIWDIRTDKILGYEALGRDPNGELSIQELFKQYDAIGQLREIKAFCFKQQLKMGVERGLKKLFLNVDFDLLAYLGEIEKPFNIEVFLEISELETMKKVEQHLTLVDLWRSRGYQFVIDDFGAGFVSFPFLVRLVPDYIKIDRSVMLQAVASPEFKGFFAHLVEGLRQYARCGIIVEGIETKEELEVVQSIGLTLIQGYLLGRPKELPND